MPDEAFEERKYLMSGLRTARDWELLLRSLGNLGLVVEPVRRDATDSITTDDSKEQLYDKILSSITRESDFVGREHMLAFQRRHASDVKQWTVTNAMHALLRPNVEGRRVDPIEIGLIVVPRSEAAIGELAEEFRATQRPLGHYEISCTYGIQIGSIISFAESYSPDNIELYQYGKASADFINRMATFFSAQIRDCASVESEATADILEP